MVGKGCNFNALNFSMAFKRLPRDPSNLPQAQNVQIERVYIYRYLDTSVVRDVRPVAQCEQRRRPLPSNLGRNYPLPRSPSYIASSSLPLHLVSGEREFGRPHPSDMLPDFRETIPGGRIINTLGGHHGVQFKKIPLSNLLGRRGTQRSRLSRIWERRGLALG